MRPRLLNLFLRYVAFVVHLTFFFFLFSFFLLDVCLWMGAELARDLQAAAAASSGGDNLIVELIHGILLTLLLEE